MNQIYEVHFGSLDLAKPGFSGQTENTACIRSVFLLGMALFGGNGIRLHRRCRGFEPLTAHHIFNYLLGVFEVLAGLPNL